MDPLTQKTIETTINYKTGEQRKERWLVYSSNNIEKLINWISDQPNVKTVHYKIINEQTV